MTIKFSHFNQKVQIVKGKWSNALRSEPCCILFCSLFFILVSFWINYGNGANQFETREKEKIN